jgi:hypothetical protein
MAETGMRRVFLKPCHSSSASGIAAVETDGGERWLAVTPAVLSHGPEGARLHNSRRLQRLRGRAEVAALVDAVCRERPLAERWFPKDSIGGRNYDLRILVIAGAAAHTVIRTSASPITDLHLGNARGDPESVRERLGDHAWNDAMRIAEGAARCFPGCHYAGVDLQIGAGRRTFCIAEVNAFGDLLPGIVWRGMDTAEAELRAWIHWTDPSPACSRCTSTESKCRSPVPVPWKGTRVRLRFSRIDSVAQTLFDINSRRRKNRRL